jgi:mannose-6-phosphate isomerase
MRSSDQMAERPWGTWTVLREGTGYKVKLIEVWPGHRLSLQSHQYRSEHWVVVLGNARVVNGDQVLELSALESTVIPVETVHRLENPGSHPLVIVEVQTGEILSEEDIIRLEDDYQRADLG